MADSRPAFSLQEPVGFPIRELPGYVGTGPSTPPWRLQ